MQTANGRQMERWEYDASTLIKQIGILHDSSQGRALYRLSEDELIQLTAVFDPSEDTLISIDGDGFSVDHGSVGTRGVEYDFR